MNITPPNGSFPENSLQSAYAKQTQVSSEIAATENNKPQQVNAPAGVAIDQKINEKGAYDTEFTLPSPEFPAEVSVNVPVSVALARVLSEELSQFPDIDHEKVSSIMNQLNSGKLTVDSDELAGAMMKFYQSGR
jgi:flagellar biosynthesis anti-sigma factor FlgM